MPSDSTRVRDDLAQLLEDWHDDEINMEMARRELQAAGGKLAFATVDDVVDDLSAPNPDAVQGGPLE